MGKGKHKGKAPMETLNMKKELNIRTTSQEQKPYPWLVLLQRKEKKKPVSKSEKSVPESNCFGWVVIMGNYDPEQEFLSGKEGYYLWNPETLESIPLPPLQLKPGECIIGMQLTSPPENKDCVFVMYVYEPWGIYCCSLNDGDRKWLRTDCSKEIKDIGNGKLAPARLTEPKDHTRCMEKFVESCGDVLCIQLEPGIGDDDDITILKLDFSDKKLKETKSFPWLIGLSQRLSHRLNHG